MSVRMKMELALRYVITLLEATFVPVQLVMNCQELMFAMVSQISSTVISITD